MTVQLIHGNCFEVIPTLPDCSVDSIVTDPPYELGFMGKKWDASGIAYNITLWQECLRVLKPGGHLLAFGGTRTYHRMACAIEDAGFEIRDSIHWLYGSGFPKSLDVSKAIDKQAGAEREIIGKHPNPAGSKGNTFPLNQECDITAPATEQAKQWSGWGTALKPAHEPVVVARKPLVGTVAQNVLEYGTGAINIDASRIGSDGGGTLCTNRNNDGDCIGHPTANGSLGGGVMRHASNSSAGRWPANIILSHHEDCDTECVPGCAVAELDKQSGVSKSQGGRIGKKDQSTVSIVAAGQYEAGDPGYGDTGGASRFFYCAKPSRRERNTGLDHLKERPVAGASGNAYMGVDSAGERKMTTQNHHPTVKPIALMRYLVRLVTPPNGTVLEPFAGSGTTLMACVLEGFDAIGIEMTDEYLPIIEGRVAWAEQEANKQQEELF